MTYDMMVTARAVGYVSRVGIPDLETTDTTPGGASYTCGSPLLSLRYG